MILKWHNKNSLALYPYYKNTGCVCIYIYMCSSVCYLNQVKQCLWHYGLISEPRFDPWSLNHDLVPAVLWSGASPPAAELSLPGIISRETSCCSLESCWSHSSNMSFNSAAGGHAPWRNSSLLLGGGRDPPLSDQGETIIGVYLLLLGRPPHTHTICFTFCVCVCVSLSVWVSVCTALCVCLCLSVCVAVYLCVSFSLYAIVCVCCSLVPCLTPVSWCVQGGCPGLETASSSSFCTDREPTCSPPTTWPLTWPCPTPASLCLDTPEASSRSSTSSRAAITSSPPSGPARYQTHLTYTRETPDKYLWHTWDTPETHWEISYHTYLRCA